MISQGVLMTDGLMWKEQRRFTIRQLKDFGLGKTSQEDMILDEVTELMASLQVNCSSFIMQQPPFIKRGESFIVLCIICVSTTATGNGPSVS